MSALGEQARNQDLEREDFTFNFASICLNFSFRLVKDVQYMLIYFLLFLLPIKNQMLQQRAPLIDKGLNLVETEKGAGCTETAPSSAGSGKGWWPVDRDPIYLLGDLAALSGPQPPRRKEKLGPAGRWDRALTRGSAEGSAGSRWIWVWQLNCNTALPVFKVPISACCVAFFPTLDCALSFPFPLCSSFLAETLQAQWLAVLPAWASSASHYSEALPCPVSCLVISSLWLFVMRNLANLAVWPHLSSSLETVTKKFK